MARSPRPGDTDDHRSALGVTRLAILDALRRADGPLSLAQLSEQLGLHVNTVRFHIARLTEAGLVGEQQAAPTGRGRPRLVYAPTSEQETNDLLGYPLLAEILAGYLTEIVPDPEAAAEAAGREWGRYLAEKPSPFQHVTADEAVGWLAALLERLGFAPELDEDGQSLRLHACPFLTVAEHRPGIACSVHLGLMRGATAIAGGPVEITALEPFARPRVCVARLGFPTPPRRRGST